MLKDIFRSSVLFLTLFLSSCDQLTQFTLSEQTINDYLQKSGQYQKKLGISGLADANIVVSDLQTQIGRTEPNTVVLTGNAHVEIISLIGDKTANMQLTLKAQPSYDQKQGAVYLKDMALIDYKVTPENAQTMIGALAPYLNQSLKLYFNEQPIYVLNPEKSKVEALAKKLAKGLEVKPGQLIIPFTD